MPRKVTPEQHAEETKLAHDYLKHLATLNTGALLLVLAFLEKLFQKPQWIFLVGVAIVSFLIGVASTVAAQTGILENMHADGARWSKPLAAISFVGAWGGLLFGLCALAAFALRNLR